MTAILALAIAATAAQGCKRQSQAQLNCTPEQQAKLMLDSSRELTADTAGLITIDANNLFDNALFDFASILRDVKLTPLETTPESKLGSVDRLTITDDHIVASDAKGVFVFGRDGKFIGKIPFGEKSPRNDYTIDRSTGEILVYTQGSIGHYAMDCSRHWVENTPFEFQCMTATKSGDLLVIRTDASCDNRNLGPAAKSLIYTINRKGELPYYIAGQEYFPKPESAPKDPFCLLPYSDEGAVICQKACDTIFTLDEQGLHARYHIDYTSHRQVPPPPPDLEKSDAEGQDSTVCKKCRGYFFAGGAQVNTSSLFFTIQSVRAQTVFVYYDKKSGKLRGGLPAFDYRQLPPIYTPIASFGDHFAALFHTYLTEDGTEFNFVGNSLPESEKRKLKGVGHDSNPVVATYRIEI